MTKSDLEAYKISLERCKNRLADKQAEKEVISSFGHCSQLRPMIDKLTTLELIKLLNEPEKVKIPQFVADIIEEYKGKNAPILDIFDEKYLNERYRNWLISSLNAYDRAARAWLDGYEVEKTKEALYTVTLKSSGQKLFYHEKDEEYLFSNYAECFLKEHHTRKELEQANFGWVFDCEGIEVEEVQDD